MQHFLYLDGLYVHFAKTRDGTSRYLAKLFFASLKFWLKYPIIANMDFGSQGADPACAHELAIGRVPVSERLGGLRASTV
jgi:hypothetical protein